MISKILCMMMFLLISTLVYAVDEKELKELYGPRYYSADIDARYAFQRAYGHAWDKSTMEERQEFLTVYQDNIEIMAKQDAKIKDKLKREQIAKERKKKAEIRTCAMIKNKEKRELLKKKREEMKLKKEHARKVKEFNKMPKTKHIKVD